MKHESLIKRMCRHVRHYFSRAFCRHEYTTINEGYKERGYICMHCEKYIWIPLWSDKKDTP